MDTLSAVFLADGGEFHFKPNAKTMHIHQAAILSPHGKLWTCIASVDTVKHTVKELPQLQNPASTHTKACHSQQLEYNLTYEYHCTVGATCMLAEGKRSR